MILYHLCVWFPNGTPFGPEGPRTMGLYPTFAEALHVAAQTQREYASAGAIATVVEWEE